MDVGVGLWTMRSTALRPAAFPALYSELQADARLAEQLGFHSLWIAEHHFWYDGWCPAPLIAAASVLGATKRLCAGTGIHLLALTEPEHETAVIETLSALAGDRLEIGVGLGYRDPEFDGFALARRARGRRVDAALDALTDRRSDGADCGPRVWVGGFSEAAFRRAGSRGLPLLLPYSMTTDEIAAAMDSVKREADAADCAVGPVGVMKCAWVTDGSNEQATSARAATLASIREYTGTWFSLKGQPGFTVPDRLERQLQRVVDTALIGTVEEISAGLGELQELGVELTVLQLTSDGARVDHRANMERLSEAMLPVVERAPA